ncbi:cilia- and flagella-associated protein 61-like [Limulus polyphemus]|uniref:Cilia- and flagella-associated protein 61-like n=1 Tax=Limulus polyphemus TaxID=6850 RepID=A0ABM1SVN5_LIMPO|nr:cilia- and flagella-associated protein 61-like [Limulus polyphemus]
MIDSTNESTISLVAEVEGFAVGFIYVSRNVDVDLLNECFQLSPFHGLRKIQEKDEICYQQSLKPEKAENHGSSLKTQLTTGISPSGSRHSSLCNEGLPVKCRLNENGTSKHFLKASLADVISGNHIVIQHPKPVIPVQLQNNVPSYKGDPSAVCVQLFCIDKMYETRSLDFLSKVFEMFPEVEYCIITVPHLTPEFPLLNFFTRIPPYPTSVFSQVLYVFHRAGLLRDFTVEKVKEEDFHDVSMFLGKFDHSLNMLEDVKQCLHFSQKKERKQIQAFVAKSYSDVVGIGIIGFEEDSEFLRAHYDIDSFCLYEQLTPQEHSHLHHFVINPIFNHLSKHFLKEILRLSGTINLYYQIQPSHSGILQGSKTCTVTVLEDLVPVCPRSMITYPLVELGVNAPAKRLLENPADFALYIMNKKLCFKKKIVLNIRIVVVGASEVGLAFLEALVMSSDLQFNYLTLVAPHGLPGELIPDELRETFHPQSHCYCPQRLHQLCMSTWVNQVYGTMTSIDKELKVIEVDSKAEIPYDILILCCGNQWQLSSSSNIHSFLRGTGLDSVTPKSVNLFLINDEFDIATALNWIETVFLKTTNNAVVYGRYLEVYSSIATLLKLGVSGSQITLISPSTTPEESSVFSNYEIAQTVNNSLLAEGVHMIENCEVLTWCTTDNLITSVTVQVGTQEETIDCGVLFLYDKKDVSSTTFKAINDANLVYDGRLVVDSSFQTNDPYIFAAGSLTKFSRKYCMDGITHQSFNSKEVGEKLAEKILLILNPIQHNNDHSPEPDALLTFTKPTVVYTNLPGGWKYLQVDRPGRQHLPYEESMHTVIPGHDIITGNMEEHGPGYFCLHLNQYNKVEAITCFTQKDLHTSNLIKLFGLHQSLLNNLLPKYKEGLITDLYSYFNESWCLAVYHDCFPGLLKDLRDIMISKKLNSIEKEELKSANQGLVFKEELEMHVLQFLNLYHFQLPMYAQQEMI